MFPIEIAKIQFEDIKNQFTRYKKYFDTMDNQISIPVKLLKEDEEIESLFDEVKNHKDRSFFLFGKGGTGKTHLFMELFNKLIKCEELGIVPFYIPLNSVQPEKYSNCIIGELTERLKNPSTRSNLTENEVRHLLQSEDVNILLLADGLNEVTQKDIRIQISRALSDIAVSKTYINTHVMLSSRENHSLWFQGLGLTSYTQLEIQNLSHEAIDNYLDKAGCIARYKDIPATTKKLLKTAMGLSMYSELVGNDQEKIKNFQTLGGLLKAYMCLLLNSNDTTIPYEDLLYSVAEYMINDRNSFTIYKSKLTELWECDIDSTLEQLTSVLCSQGANSDGIDEYTFSHQNFRDALISKKFAERILELSRNNNVDDVAKIIRNDHLTTNRELMGLTADFLQGKSSEIQGIIQMMPKNNSRSFQLSVLIDLYARINHHSIATLDLSDHDLSDIRLSGYRLFDKNARVTIKGCKLAIETFSMPGLTQASQTITKYKIDDKLFLIAFSITSYLRYDVNENEVLVNKNLENYGRVVCCCNVTIDNQEYIILGTDNGFIHKFNTCSLEICYNITDNDMSSDKKAIDSIVYLNSKIFFTKKEKQEGSSTIEYRIFSFDLSRPSEVEIIRKDESYYTSDVFLELKNQYFNKNEYSILKQQIDRSRGRLSQTNTVLYYAFENNVFIFKDNEFQPIELCNIPETIGCRKFTDIIVSNSYMLLNNDDNILAFYLSDDTDTIVAKYIDSISISDYKEKSGDYFTKFSRSDKDNCILVGIGINNDDLRGNINFLEVEICNIDYWEENFTLNCSPLCGLHTKTTYTGVYFSQDQGRSKLLATVSDDRSIQVMQPGNEDFEKIQLLGEYNGIHSIVIIDNTEDRGFQSIICAGYDGSIEKWQFSRNVWRCAYSSKIHRNWIWKIKYIKYKNKEFVFSCSYDGTIKMTDLTSDFSRTLLKTSTKIYDIDVKLDKEDKISIIATTDFGYYSLISFSFEKLLEKFYLKNSIGLLFHHLENKTVKNNGDSFYYRLFSDKFCMGRSVIVKEINKLFVAVFNKERKMVSIEKISNTDSLPESIGEISGFYARCMDISDHYLALAGNLTSETDKGYICLYNIENDIVDVKTKIFSYSFEKCSSVNDVKIKINDDVVTIYSLHKDKWLNIITFSINDVEKSVIKNTKIMVRTQPMCLAINKNDHIFIGTVDGEVSLVEQENDILESKTIIQVRANLISDGNILINKSNELKQSLNEFKQTFIGYFVFR